MKLYPSTVQAPGVVLLRRYAEQIEGGQKFFSEAANEMYADLEGQLTLPEVEALLRAEVADVDPDVGWAYHPSMPVLDKLLHAQI